MLLKTDTFLGVLNLFSLSTAASSDNFHFSQNIEVIWGQHKETSEFCQEYLIWRLGCTFSCFQIFLFKVAWFVHGAFTGLNALPFIYVLVNHFFKAEFQLNFLIQVVEVHHALQGLNVHLYGEAVIMETNLPVLQTPVGLDQSWLPLHPLVAEF